MESGTIASWNKEEGDSFGPGDVLCSVETDKATVDFEAQDDGVVAKILASAGPTEIKCGEPILVTVEEEDDVAAFKDFVAEKTESVQEVPKETVSEETPVPQPVASAAPVPPPSPVSGSGGRVVASPLAHMIAKDIGHDITAIAGTGPDGRIIAADVREFVPTLASAGVSEGVPAAAVATPPIPGDGFTDFPISDSSKEIAQRLMQSKRNVPHYYLTVDVTMDELLRLKETLGEMTSADDDQIGVYEMIIKATAASMKTVPSANAAWMESVVRVYDSVDVNVVVGSGDSLYAPVIRDCGSKGLKGISEELNAAVDAVENDDLTSEFASMGTVTVMNLGMYGIKSCAPIIREPQSVALAIGALENRIVPNDDPESDEIYKESVVLTATLSCDHRVVDGAVGAQWLSAFKSYLENPSTLLL